VFDALSVLAVRSFVRPDGNVPRILAKLLRRPLMSAIRLPDGTVLLKSGPIWGTKHPLGVGACGACEVFRVSVYHLDSRQKLSRVFDQSVLLESPEADGDIQLSADWKTITVYRATVGIVGGQFKLAWTSTKLCLSAAEDDYRECGAGSPKPPPAPRQVPSHAQN
jgi:hypothetical protein